MLKKIAMAATLIGVGAVAGLTVGGQRAVAQLSPPPGGIKRTVLQKVEVPGSNYEVIMAVAEIPAGVASIGRHTHPGIEIGTLLDGETTLELEGQPVRVVKPGESYQVPAGVPHDAKTGAAPGKVLAVYIVEKGKPLATPAPK
jgi:quercetin dioxygenase-like cupin family protein